ncbi:MAG: DNA translocase FtsK 4TM domain-containing protein, partial [Elusimicrobiota bacterium]|nr:DNA translocase FtsK 4TM domain-containing protein [Elusimicrobiota bacterium]
MSKKDRNKKADKRKAPKKNRDIIALFFALTAFISAYAIIMPYESGIIGIAFSNLMFQIFGTAAYIFPIILLWHFVIYISKSMEIREKTDFLWSVLCIASASILFTPMRENFMLNAYGGWIGNKLYPFFEELFGMGLAFTVIFIVFVFSSFSLFRISLISICANIIEDIKNRNEEKQKQPKIIEKTPEPAPIYDKPNSAAFPFPKKDEPTIIRKDAPINKEIKKINKPNKDFDYILPRTDILEKDRALDSKAKIKDLRERARLLENT